MGYRLRCGANSDVISTVKGFSSMQLGEGMEEAEIKRLLLGFTGANINALTAWLMQHELNNDREPITPEEADRRAEEIRKFLDN